MGENGYRLRSLTDRHLLLHVPDSHIQTAEERALVDAYRQKHLNLISLESKARTLRAGIRGFFSFLFKGIPYLILAGKIRLCRKNLLVSESDPRLQGLIRRERASSIQKIAELHHNLIEDITEKRALRRKYFAGETDAVQDMRKAVLLAMNACENGMTSVGKLALATMLSVLKIHKRNAQSFVCRTNLASCDTVIYSAFLVRDLALRQGAKDAPADPFTEEFFHHISCALSQLFPIGDTDVKEMFQSRMTFYDRIFAKKPGTKSGLQAVQQKFEQILKTDAYYGRYVAFGENTPLPFLGMEEDQKCRSEVAAYQSVLLETIQADLKAVQEDLK